MSSYFFLCLFLMCACSVAAPTATPGIVGVVDIVNPQDGSVIYAPQLYLSGTASEDAFVLQLVGSDGNIIARNTVQVGAGEWQVELAHGYSGEPMEVTIFALPEDADIPSSVDYDVATVIIAGESYRPEGAFGNIVNPQQDSTVGGYTIEVSGTVSGVFENTFTLTLRNLDGNVIDNRPITVFNPYFMDEVPWSAELATNGFTGQVEIRASYLSPADGSEQILASVVVAVSQDAG